MDVYKENIQYGGSLDKLKFIIMVRGDLHLSDITTKNVGENYLNIRIKYTMIMLDN